MSSSDKKNDYGERSLEAHKQFGGKLEIRSKMPLDTREDLIITYTPGVAEPCRAIAENQCKAYEFPWKGNTVAVVKLLQHAGLEEVCREGPKL